MSFLQDLFFKPFPSDKAPEVNRLITELIKIGKTDDFLADHFQMPVFNAQHRHNRARQIGARLDEIGGMALMEYAHREVRRKASKTLADHLEYCWDEVGKWRA